MNPRTPGAPSLRTRAVVCSLLAHAAVVLVPATWLASMPGADDAALLAQRGTPVSFYEETSPATGVVEPPALGAVSDPAPPQTMPPDPFAGDAPRVAGGLPPAPRPGAPSPSPGPPDDPAEGAPAVYRPARLLVGALPPVLGETESLEIHVRLRIDREGSVVAVEMLTPGLSGPVQETVRAAAAVMRFVPARRGETAVESWVSMSFRN